MRKLVQMSLERATHPLLLSVVLGLTACGGGDSTTVAEVPPPVVVPPPAKDPNAPIELATLSPIATCASLSGKTLPASAMKIPSGAVNITGAVLVSATAGTQTNATNWNPAIPEYCKVNGSFTPIDPTAPASNFQVNLPTQWTQRAIHLGNSGLGGSIPAAMNSHKNSPESQPADVGGPVSKGFITIGTDAGHGVGNTWMLNAEAVTNYAYGSNKRAHDAAYELASQYYGEKPKLSYWAGSSQGGREGLTMAQMFPDDFDGIFVQVPVTNLLSLTLRGTVMAQKQTTAETWVPASKGALVGNEVLRQCDALDGIADGVVSAFEACNSIFVNPVATAKPWTAIRCASGIDEGATCLSDGQIATLNAMHTDVDYGYPLGHGINPGYAGYGVGGEVTYGFSLESSMPTAAYSGGLFQVFWKSLLTGNPTFPQMTWNPANYKTQFQTASALVDGVNPDLSKFLERGGKFILKTNSGDYTSNWRETVLYYKRIVERLGQPNVDKFMRFYVAPGQQHSMGATIVQRGAYGDEIPSSFDFVTLLDNWVAGKVVPSDSIMLTQKQAIPPFTVSSTRPICRYPTFPRYVGGDRMVGTNYRCAAN